MKIPRKETVAIPRKYGDRAERDLAKTGLYRTTVASGSKSEKGDLRRGNWMVEVKATTADSYRVTSDTMGKLRNDGLTNARPGALIVVLGDGTKLAIMELRHFEDLTGAD